MSSQLENLSKTMIPEEEHSNMARLIFLGAPGAGKGTQGQIIAEAYRIEHISTGDLLRCAVVDKTSLGQEAESFISKGQLVPTPLILKLVQNHLTHKKDSLGWILDGFPRTQEQAIFLENLLDESNQTCDGVIQFSVVDQVLIERLLSRGRKDDTAPIIQERLWIYHKQTAEVIQFYRELGRLVVIDGNQPVNRVTQELYRVLQTLLQKPLPLSHR